MAGNSRIVVVAGNRDQFQYWLRHNIIPVTSRHDVDKLRGIKIEKVYYEGTYHEWLDREADDMLRYMIDKHYAGNSNKGGQP